MIKKLILLLAISVFVFMPAFADEETKLGYKALSDFEQAMVKFKESNVIAAYSDFNQIINENLDNDYINLVIGGKLSDIGLFNLAEKSLSQIKDEEFKSVPLDNIKNFFYQSNKMTQKDEIYLAEVYSNIIYNSQSKEMASEITANDELREKYDYANYLAALALYKSNNIEEASKYIEIAGTKNPKNLTYKLLSARILADMGNKDKAIKIIENIKKNLILTNYYKLKVNETEQYILYKTAKTDKRQNYHLGYYYYYRGDYLRALKVLPQALEKNKKENSKIYALISSNFVALKEYEKALKNAQLSYKSDRKNSQGLIALGDLKYLEKDYKSALRYYKDAMKEEKTSYDASVKTAKTYLALGKLPKAQEILLKLLKGSSDCYEAYYLIGLIEPDKELAYLKKAVGLNTEFTDGWLALANYELNKSNYILAQNYLNNAYNLDQNNYKYYYYQGLIFKNNNDIKNAQYNFQKSYKINPEFINVKKELKK